jgi:hypothetical protein
VDAAPGHQHTVSAPYLAVDGESHRVEAIYADCDDTIDDCSFLIYDFPQLKKDAAGVALTYEGETVAVLSNAGARVALTGGYRLGYRRVEDGSSYRIEVFLANSPAAPVLSYYQGALTLRGETRAVCFALSPEKVDSAAGDPDLGQGVYVSQAIPSFRERGPSSPVDCATSLEFNGDYLKTCGGLFLIGATSLSHGDIFTQMERYNSDGSLKVQPVGTFEFQRVDSCPK